MRDKDTFEEANALAKLKYQNTELWLNIRDEEDYTYVRTSDIESVEIILGYRFIVRANMISGRVYIIAECQTMESAKTFVDRILKLISSPKELIYVNLENIDGQRFD